MVNTLRKLPFLDAEAEMLREIASEWREMAELFESESLIENTALRRRARAANAVTLRWLEQAYDPRATLEERYAFVGTLGKGLVEQSREAIRRSRAVLDLPRPRALLN